MPYLAEGRQAGRRAAPKLAAIRLFARISLSYPVRSRLMERATKSRI
jgi:hypothetical protein